MVLLNQGAESIAIALGAFFTQGQIGTGTSFEKATDTELETPLSGTQFNLTKTISGTVIRLEYNAPPGIATDEDVSEFTAQNSSGDSINRKTIGVFNKGSNIDLTIVNTWRVTQ